MSSLRERDLPQARLEEVLGAKPAGILMSHISTETGLATTANFDAPSTAVDARFDYMDERFDRVDHRLDHLEASMVRFATNSTDSTRP